MPDLRWTTQASSFVVHQPANNLNNLNTISHVRRDSRSGCPTGGKEQPRRVKRPESHRTSARQAWPLTMAVEVVHCAFSTRTRRLNKALLTPGWGRKDGCQRPETYGGKGHFGCLGNG